MTNRYCQSAIIERIIKKSVLRETGCIEYCGGKLKHKYGLVSVPGNWRRKVVPAHRAMYMAVNNCFDLPERIYVLHSCDNPCCVNIGHLRAGTPKDNYDDCVLRNRLPKERKHPIRHRTPNDAIVDAIRNATGKQKWIAEEFGVSIGYVSKIKNFKLKKTEPDNAPLW